MAEQAEETALAAHLKGCERCRSAIARNPLTTQMRSRRDMCIAGFRAWRDDQFTPTQERLFLLIANAPHPMSIREIGEAVGYRSTNGVIDAIRILIRKGVLADTLRPDGRLGAPSRNIQLPAVLPKWASRLLDVCWCPRCRGELRDAGRELSCARCGWRGTIAPERQ